MVGVRGDPSGRKVEVGAESPTPRSRDEEDDRARETECIVGHGLCERRNGHEEEDGDVALMCVEGWSHEFDAMRDANRKV